MRTAAAVVGRVLRQLVPDGLQRRRTLVAAVLLPALALRALIPMGCMPGSGGLEFCDGGFDSHATMHADRYSGTPGSSNGTAHGDGCVFAGSAAGLAPPPVVAAVAALIPLATQLALPESSDRPSSPIIRAQSPRGPPPLS